MGKEEEITAENLPLSVREHLMRGNQIEAISVLEEEYNIEKESAEQLIEDYRTVLRERKIALDIQIMNEKNAKESEEDLQMVFKWGARIVLFALCIFVLYAVTEMVGLQ
ncbi:MAG: hypothetical protein KGV50_04290 [Gammaproteobacteria bacterium]|nr:hypothetical protein [Gammaproteobacteria bacterium]